MRPSFPKGKVRVFVPKLKPPAPAFLGQDKSLRSICLVEREESFQRKEVKVTANAGVRSKMRET